MPRHEILDTRRVAAALRVLPRILGRPLRTSDVARVFACSVPTAAKYSKRAAQAGLLEGSEREALSMLPIWGAASANQAEPLASEVGPVM
jgi:hypothetical protein